MDDQRLVSVKPPNSAPISNSSRLKVVASLVLKAYLCAGQPQPDTGILAFEGGAWEEALSAAGVPDEALEEVYRRAIGQHTSPFRLSTGELITAWQAIQKERRQAILNAQAANAAARLEQAEAERRANVAAFEARMRELT